VLIERDSIHTGIAPPMSERVPHIALNCSSPPSAISRFRRDLLDSSVLASSPTWADLVSLEQSVGNRTAIYSSADTVMAGRTSEWQRLARAYDVPWLTHNTDKHIPWLAPAIAACANDDDPGEILARH
jgi:hypothetical protein